MIWDISTGAIREEQCRTPLILGARAGEGVYRLKPGLPVIHIWTICSTFISWIGHSRQDAALSRQASHRLKPGLPIISYPGKPGRLVMSYPGKPCHLGLD